MRYYQAVALDLDGTISTGGAPAADVLSAIRAARAEGVRLLLVTGRILADLAVGMPGLSGEFDAVVAENGAVLAVGGRTLRLADPVDPGLAGRLQSEGVRVHRGQVVLAVDSSEAGPARDAVRAMQLDVQLVWNRSDLMLLPGGVTKGSGVQAGLAALGVSPHSAVGVGDAENDQALLQACELGVAVGNAVAPLAEQADLVLSEPNGAGVIDLLARIVGAEPLRSARRRLVVGTAVSDKRPVGVPASPRTVLITGRSGSGRSSLTGLLAEQMIEQGYSVFLVDAEGDHADLGALRNTMLVGDSGRLPGPGELVRVIGHERSVVLDLSARRTVDVASYVRELHRRIRLHRERTGLPHWFVIAEGHIPLGLESPHHEWGYCLTTDRADALDHETIAGMGWQIEIRADRPDQAVLTPLVPGTGASMLLRILGRRPVWTGQAT